MKLWHTLLSSLSKLHETNNGEVASSYKIVLEYEDNKKQPNEKGETRVWIGIALIETWE